MDCFFLAFPTDLDTETFLSKNAPVIFELTIKNENQADDKTDNHKDRTYFSTNKRLYDPCDYQTSAYDQCSKPHDKAVRLLILFGHLTAIIPMNRGYVATHIKYSQYSYNRT